MLRRLASVTMVLAAVAGACGPTNEDGGATRVVAGFGRLAELARAVGGGTVQVRDLTPPGAEPHDRELTSDDLDAVEEADVVLYLGGDFQPAVLEAARRAERAVDLLHPGEDDPHIWLDPPRYAEAVDAVAQALASVDPAGRAGYVRRAAGVRGQVEALHAEYLAGLRQCQRRVIVTAHAAFGRLAHRYGLRQEALTGLSPESEPSPARLAELTDLVEREGVTHVFTERLAPPRVAESLAREAGVGVAVLDPLEGRTQGDYWAAMRRNLATLREVLGCA